MEARAGPTTLKGAIEDCMGCFYPLAIMDSADMNMHVC